MQKSEYRDIYNDKLISFLVTGDILALCSKIEDALYNFYNRPKFFRFGKRKNKKDEIKYKLSENTFWERAEATIAYIYKRPVHIWSNEDYKNLAKKNGLNTADSNEMVYISTVALFAEKMLVKGKGRGVLILKGQSLRLTFFVLFTTINL